MTDLLLLSVLDLTLTAERKSMLLPEVITTDTVYFGPMVLIWLVLLIGAKVGGTFFFWLFSYILGNKLADLLHQTDPPPARPPFTKQHPRPRLHLNHPTKPAKPNTGLAGPQRRRP